MILFDSLTEELWKRKVEQMLQQHHADLIRLLREHERPRSWYGLMPHAADAFEGITAGGTNESSSGSQIVEGLLDTALNYGGVFPSTTTLSVYEFDGTSWTDTGNDITVTNHDENLSGRAGDYLAVGQSADGSYRPLAGGRPWSFTTCHGFLDDDLYGNNYDDVTSATLSVYDSNLSDTGVNVSVYTYNDYPGILATAGDYLVVTRAWPPTDDHHNHFVPIYFGNPYRLGVTDAAISRGSAGTVSVYRNGSDTGDNLVAYNYSPDLASGASVVLRKIEGLWYVL